MEKDENSVDEKSDLCEVPFEDALDIVGSGKYNTALILTGGLLLLAMAMELFGFAYAVTASTCDLQLTIQQQGILSSLGFISIICSSFLWGYLADTRGRRLVLMWCMATSFVLSSLSSLSPNWIVLAVIKFVSICFSCAGNSVTYTLLGECSPLSVRTRHLLLASIPFMFSQGLTGLIAYPVLALEFAHDLPWLGITYRPWRLLLFILAAPCGIGAVLMYFISESPKFLASQGRNDEAVEVLRRIYCINRGVEPENFQVRAVILQESTVMKAKSQSLLGSMWHQTIPLFQRPLLVTTLRLYFLVSVIYITNNSFVVWFPRLFMALFANLNGPGDSPLTLCSLISTAAAVKSNITYEFHPELCNDKIDLDTIWAIVFQSGAMTLLSVCVAELYSKKKAVIMACLTFPAISAICVPLMPEPISGVLFFFVFCSTAIAAGIVSAYFVELYPTSYRGMVACLGVMVGRLSSFFGINLVGGVIFTHCEVTFYAWAILLFSGIVVAYYLPPDKAKQAPSQSS